MRKIDDFLNAQDGEWMIQVWAADPWSLFQHTLDTWHGQGTATTTSMPQFLHMEKINYIQVC